MKKAYKITRSNNPKTTLAVIFGNTKSEAIENFVYLCRYPFLTTDLIAIEFVGGAK